MSDLDNPKHLFYSAKAAAQLLEQGRGQTFARLLKNGKIVQYTYIDATDDNGDGYAWDDKVYLGRGFYSHTTPAAVLPSAALWKKQWENKVPLVTEKLHGADFEYKTHYYDSYPDSYACKKHFKDPYSGKYEDPPHWWHPK